MKNTLLLLSLVLMGIFTFSQAPQAFKYQAVARDLNGNPVINLEISVKISILAGSPEGTLVYSEIHQTTTNSMGLLNLEVGNGTVETGNFTSIDWGNNAFFIKTEIDLASSGQFQVLGVMQFLSVPYAKYADNSGFSVNSGFSTIANGIQTMTEQQRNALENPPVGMQIFNSTTNCLNYFNGAAWFETCGQCTPLPTQASAGEDQYFADATFSTTLQGNIPVHGTGTWTIESGTGGSFANANDPQTLFTGQQCESYSLKWTITTACGSATDNVSVTFFETPTPANAGEDQTNVQATWTALAANTPMIGQGQWTIIEGTGGQLITPNSPNSIFLGQDNSIYLLEWKISTICTNSTDTVQIIFGCPLPTTANAGPDQLNYDVTSTILQGNTPDVGIGHWSLVSGVGGSLSNPENPSSTFTGQVGEAYELQWTITNECGLSNDNVIISFISWSCGMNLFDIRDGIIYTTIQLGTQCWMKQNLDIGSRIADTSNQTNNGIIEKYCYNNSETNCTIYGGLYQWDEMMQYTTTGGIKGICPTGWHLPTDAEWTTLTTFVSSQTAFLCNSNSSYIAKSLAATTNWNSWSYTCTVGYNRATNNATGFTGLPGGYRNASGTFDNVGKKGHWWSSTFFTTHAYMRDMNYQNEYVHRTGEGKSLGYSVRCVRDN